VAKKLTITVLGKVGALPRQHVAEKDMDAAYREMAADTQRESEALEWAEATLYSAEDRIA
jgi:hypothetical protein